MGPDFTSLQCYKDLYCMRQCNLLHMGYCHRPWGGIHNWNGFSHICLSWEHCLRNGDRGIEGLSTKLTWSVGRNQWSFKGCCFNLVKLGGMRANRGKGDGWDQGRDEDIGWHSMRWHEEAPEKRDVKDVCWLSYNSHNVKIAHGYAQDYHGKLGPITIWHNDLAVCFTSICCNWCE